MKFTRDKEKIIRLITEMIENFNEKYDVQIISIDIAYDTTYSYLERVTLKIKGQVII